MEEFKQRRTRKEERVFAGGYIPQALNSLMSLYSVAHNQSKTEVIVELLDEWSKEKDSYDLIGLIVNKVRNQWRIEKSKMYNSPTTKDFEEFKLKTSQYLRKRGVEEKYINLIIKGLE
jgi:hypothetical protein